MTTPKDVMNVLWLDDDVPEGPLKIANADVTTVKTCRKADARLEAQVVPDWVVVDLNVPQEGWRAPKFYKRPGLQYIRHLRDKFQSKVGICAYTVSPRTPELDSALRAAGADFIAQKTAVSFHQLLEQLSRHQVGE